jgi:hypothetical protein
MYSCVDVFIKHHLALYLKHLELKYIYLVDNKEIKESGYLSHCTVVEFRRKLNKMTIILDFKYLNRKIIF